MRTAGLTWLLAGCLLAGAGLATGAVAAVPDAAAPAGWKVLKDRKGNCELLVPSAWKGSTSSAAPVDRRAMAAIHLLPGKDWAESKAMARRVMVAEAILEDGPERFWFSYTPRAAQNPDDAAPAAASPAPAPSPKASETSWYVSVPGPLGPCTAQITFKDAAMAETARQIAESVAAVAR